MASSRSNRRSPELEAPRCVVNLRGSPVGVDDYIEGLLRASHEDRQEIAHKNTELKRAHERARQLETDLNKYHEQIFRSINAFKVSDTSISHELACIQEGLSNWVAILPDSQRVGQNWSEVRKFLEDNGFVTLNFISSPEVMDLAETDLLTAVTFGILWTILFKPNLHGVSSDIRSFLDVIQTHMSLLQPEKDRAAVNTWRSDMFRAWSKSPEYASIAEAECRKASDMIAYILMLAGQVQDGHWEPRVNRLIEEILRPATALAMQMRCSLEDYSWDWTPQNSAQVQNHHFSAWNCVDLRTGCPIRNQKHQNDSGSPMIGELLVVVFPALYRLIDGEQSHLVIGKGHLLVNTGAPVARILEEPKCPKLTPDQCLESQVQEEPSSPQPTQHHSTESEAEYEPSDVVQASSQPARRWSFLRWQFWEVNRRDSI